jgi:cellulose synthase/poly-beta-1,6-N-acetylglucosamine synthase-like glycosyltransferase
MIGYIYLGYPVLIFLFSIIKHKKIKIGTFEPFVTILIAAFNEENAIEDTIKNKIALNYPKDKIEIIVISDSSTDDTDHIVKPYEEQGVKLLRQVPRSGKTSALNIAVPEAKGEILVFSDANSIYEKDALKKLVRNFADPDVGYVTGKMIYTTPKGLTIGDGCSTYMKYENFLRSVETKAGSIVGVDGGIDAIRKELYKPMNPDQLPDFVLPLKVIEQGYRVVYEPEALLKEPSLKAPKDEYKMRVRVSLRALWALWDMRHLLIFTSPLLSSSGAPSHLRTFAPSFLYSWKLWSHKALRYMCFIFLVGAYLANLQLWPTSLLYQLCFIVQSMLYMIAVASPLLERNGYHLKLVFFAHYFVLLNVAAAHAFIKFVMGQKIVVWTPRSGL